jgi:hypothetical protein
MVAHTSYEDPHYAVLFSLPPLPPSKVYNTYNSEKETGVEKTK